VIRSPGGAYSVGNADLVISMAKNLPGGVGSSGVPTPAGAEKTSLPWSYSDKCRVATVVTPGGG
jgi:hypothetical protein